MQHGNKVKDASFERSLMNKLIPVLPLRDVVVYPHMVIPLFVGRKKSIRALEEAMTQDKQILLITQKHASHDDPGEGSVYAIGTIATILQLLKLPDGTVKVLAEGTHRAKIDAFEPNEDYLLASVSPLQEIYDTTVREIDITARTLLSQFEQYVKLNKKIPPEILVSLASIEDPSRLGDAIAAHLTLKIEERQQVLEIQELQKRLEKILVFMESEMDTLQIEKQIQGRVKRQMAEGQRAYYLNEQMKAIQTELGDMGHIPNELDTYAKRIDDAGMTKEAKEKAEAELNKLKMMSPMSAEATVSRNYLDWMLNVPWKKKTKINYNLKEAQKILDHDHYGLEKIKERIIEFLAVQQRVKKLKGPVLCLVGPPGVGKTSLGQSIAKATGRKFVRMSLGGVRDEAEIRGHRRTYIGALPGKPLQKLAKIGVKNPLFLLDEIDKMSTDFRGDPASALLEVLDPEQNHTFNDHYLEVDYDLSNILFIATANSLNIPGPLLDRMEVIRLAGYTEDEKISIALQYLIPKQLEANGLNTDEIKFSELTVRDIIRYYTREAGVRNLERDISKICRKVVKRILIKAPKHPIIIKSSDLEKYLGVKRFRFGVAESHTEVGQVYGLAWTEAGGELLTIETAATPGKGKTTYTGHLGDIMQESIKAALTVVRSRAEHLGISPDFYEKFDIHVHVPEGATPKDGPSAGIGMCTAIVSALTKIPVRSDFAMTGEITLRGEVLPIGGLKEKLLAALRAGIKHVIIPHENERDLIEIPKNIKHDLEIHPVRWIDEVISLALAKPTASLEKKSQAPANDTTLPSNVIKNDKADPPPPSH
ncbi:MAG: endopeptidase La [Gammaproteobacteria bacterium RIFCSPLOWO2_02_FULL_38_11]|nr:MAG: endopeptidase La [Gammaproteobacteria bacterium RIFCSPHIGHO2_02_FULL_38_33]OGT69089.1 MAG: endopeptidase La [Gammaproteobacteria bacterium RIFCSPLOWO2_02_FULL_38_11]OGT76470.1 MAG: endopeptidase La [Gammaproteobacteria bacterium RIFCSPLOWO2_12_FULL_38_14]